MSVASIVVLVVLFAFVALALWRNFRKGAPCSCGCSCGECSCGKESQENENVKPCCRCGEDMV